jgi:iron complex outermembrane recepter protein
MSKMNHRRNPGLQPLTLHQAVKGILLASALTVSVSGHADSIDTADKRSYHISSGSLSHALSQFAANAGILLSADAKLTDGKTSKGLDGEYTVEEGFQKLLSGTGLAHTYTDDKTVTLKVAESQSQVESILPAVKVIGKASYDSTDPYNPDYSLPNASTATKMDTPIMETPFSVQVVPKQVLEDQQVVRLDKALNNVAGVLNRPGNGGGQDMSYIRGFANNAYYRDGFVLPTTIGGGGTTKRDTANLERVEVLKGPGSILFGRAEPGGVVNMVTKQPLDTPYYSMQQQFGSFDFYRTTIDATGSVIDDKSVKYRLNMAYENSGSYLNNVDGERVFVAPVVSWDISPKTKASLEIEYLHFDDPFDHGVPALAGTNRPAPVPRSFTLNEPSFNKNAGDRTGVFMNWSHTFNDNWTISHRFGAEFMDWNTLGVTFGVAAANGNLTRNFYALRDQNSQRYFNTLNLTGKFDTGFLKHTLLLGYEHFQLDAGRSLGSQSSPAAFNVFNPSYMSQGPTLFPSMYTSFKLTQNWDGFYAQDQIELPNNIFALAGVRYDQSETQFDRNNQLFKLSKDNMVTPRGGMLWRPVNWLSLYGSYTENFGPSNYLSNTADTNLSPQTAQQWEVGTKTKFWDGRFTASVAYFDLSKQNLAVPILGTIFSKTIGSAESRGIEFETTGEIIPGLRLIGAYAYMPFAKVTNDPTNLGNRLPMAPENSGSLWATYEIQSGGLNGLKFGGGVIAAGQREGNDSNTFKLPGYATLNLMSSYAIKVGHTKVTTQVNVDNLLDKTYFSGSNGQTGSWYGAPRTVMGAIRVEY